jgi:hypothetical protein
MLRICAGVLAEASEPDRQLVDRLTGDEVAEGPQSDRERQRLKRLRDRLRAAVEERLGSTAADLLRSGD